MWADVAKAAEPANSTERLEFARAAALIASGQGKDDPPQGDAAKAKLRGQALDWLKAELTVTVDLAGKARIIAAAAPLPGLLEKLAESAPMTDRSRLSWPDILPNEAIIRWQRSPHESPSIYEGKLARNRRTRPWLRNWLNCC